ncbi:MAG: metalloregulator ArsR/SmtB family transcription factor [Proteobacteria bacterium]|nr:metalloregulator ArsR/SmtB family transcription factor [Pseudomonadota bacterium]
MDEVFKALADPNRRKILDIVRDQPGINVNDLSQHFDFSRFATMKHLRLLEEAKLLLGKKEGKDKRLYINAVPIQMIYERWIRNYEGHWAASLTKLKGRIERDNS